VSAEEKMFHQVDSRVVISEISRPSPNLSLPMMLIWRTLERGPSSISNTTSTRFWSSWTIFGSTRAA
jgi:hypothetical protein